MLRKILLAVRKEAANSAIVIFLCQHELGDLRKNFQESVLAKVFLC